MFNIQDATERDEGTVRYGATGRYGALRGATGRTLRHGALRGRYGAHAAAWERCGALWDGALRGATQPSRPSNITVLAGEARRIVGVFGHPLETNYRGDPRWSEWDVGLTLCGVTFDTVLGAEKLQQLHVMEAIAGL